MDRRERVKKGGQRYFGEDSLDMVGGGDGECGECQVRSMIGDGILGKKDWLRNMDGWVVWGEGEVSEETVVGVACILSKGGDMCVMLPEQNMGGRWRLPGFGDGI